VRSSTVAVDPGSAFSMRVFSSSAVGIFVRQR
jgi:hypothetical protein